MIPAASSHRSYAPGIAEIAFFAFTALFLLFGFMLYLFVDYDGFYRFAFMIWNRRAAQPDPIDQRRGRMRWLTLAGAEPFVASGAHRRC